MPFIPDSFWGVTYLAALALAASAAFWRGSLSLKHLAIISIVNWLMVRGIASGVIQWDVVPLAIPAITAISMAIVGGKPVGFACAGLMAAMALIEQVAWFYPESYIPVAAAEDFLGLLSLALIFVASIVGPHDHGFGDRHSNVLRTVEARRSALAPLGLHRLFDNKNHSKTEKDGGQEWTNSMIGRQ
jgi:hypothetical protein